MQPCEQPQHNNVRAIRLPELRQSRAQSIWNLFQVGNLVLCLLVPSLFQLSNQVRIRGEQLIARCQRGVCPFGGVTPDQLWQNSFADEF